MIKKLEDIIYILFALFLLSLPLSLLNAAKAFPCKTYGYYLPATFIMCNINKEREQK